MNRCACVMAAIVLGGGPLAWGQGLNRSDAGDDPVQAAIRKAVAYLWSAQDPQEHHWEGVKDAVWLKKWNDLGARDGLSPGFRGGPTALVLLSLLKAGQSPDDPRFVRALEWLQKLPEMDRVYAHGTRAALYASLDPRHFIKQMDNEKKWLLNAMYPDGTYGYWPPRSRTHLLNPGKSPGGVPPMRQERIGSVWRDLSNTQYGILGIWLLSEVDRIEIPARYWQLVQNGYLTRQLPDGGWKYTDGRDEKATQSMTLGALASLFIVWDKLYASDCKRQGDPALIKAIEAGLGWLGRNFNPTAKDAFNGAFYLYNAYGTERVGVATGLKYFGSGKDEKNWWVMTRDLVLRNQAPNGSWAQAHPDARSPVTTAWAILCLSYGSAPVVFNKMAYGSAGQWNSRPRDLARLTTWMGKKYEQIFSWQIMPITRPVHELMDAPILVMSGTMPIKLEDDQKAKLKEYVLRGGLLVGEAANDSRQFADSFRALMRELFPGLKLSPLPPDHLILNEPFPLAAKTAGAAIPLPKLEELSNGVRAMVLFSPHDLGCTWQQWQVVRGQAHFELGANLMFYVSDGGSGLVRRGHSYMPTDQGRKPAKNVKVGRLAWGGKFQWDPEPYAWNQFDIHLRNANKMGVSTVECDFKSPVDPKTVGLVHLTGVGPISLTDEQKKNLAAYVRGGGLVLADPAGGNPEFRDSVRKLAEELLGPLSSAVGQIGPKEARLRHVDDLPRAIRPMVLDGYKSADGRWGLLLARWDITAALAGYANLQPAGMTPQAAEEFVVPLLERFAK